MTRQHEFNLGNFVLLLIVTVWAALTVNFILPEALGLVRYILCGVVAVVAALGAGVFIHAGDIDEREESRRKDREMVRKEQGQTGTR